MAAALGGNGITLLTSRGFSCCPPFLFVNNTRTRQSYPPNSSTTKPRPHLVASLSTTSTSYSSSSSVNPPPSASSPSTNEGIIIKQEGDQEGGSSPGEGIEQQERLSDYLQLSKELVVRSKGDRGPPRWFSYYPMVPPGPGPGPLLLYLPGAAGVGSGLLLQMDGLSGMFEVRCLHIPILDRTPFPELVKLVEETVRWEASRRSRASSTAPIYLVGESFGGCLALAVASRNPHLHLILILANPATCFTKSFLPAFSQILPPDDDRRMNLGLLYVLSLASVHGGLPSSHLYIAFPWRFAMDALRKGLTLQQTFADLAECSAALSSYLSVLAELLTPETLNWKLKMLKSAAEFANSRLHAVKARTLILSSGRDPLMPSQEEGERLRRMLPNCEVRLFSNGGHALFLEDGFVLATVIKGASFYQRGRRLDYVSDYLPPKHSEFNRIYEPHRWMEVACNPVMLSRLENGKTVRGLGGIPCEGPVLFVGDHMMLGLEMIPLVAGFWKEKGIVLRGIAHPLAFRKLKDGKLPDLSTFDTFRSMGAVPVSATNLYKLLSSKAHVLLYPGGMREALHRKGEEHKLIWPEQSEFVRMAARFGAKIVPFGAVGEDDFGQLVFDYDDLMKIPYYKSAIEELTEEVEKLRSDVEGEVGNQDLHLPIIAPKLIPGRLYFLFGKPIETQTLTSSSSAGVGVGVGVGVGGGRSISREEGEEIYREVKREVEKQIAYLKEKRERDPYRNILNRLAYQAIHGFHSQVPTFLF